MAHPMNKFRQSNVERKRVGELTKGYATGGRAHSDEKQDRALFRKMFRQMEAEPHGEYAKPRRASGGRVGKKATTVVNVIMGGQQKPEEPPAPMMAPPPPPPPPGPPPAAMAPPPGGPPPGVMGPGGPPPGMPMRARGGGVKSKGMDVGTKVQHSPAHMEVGKMNRPRVVTFKTGGGVKSFTAYANGGKVPMPKPRPAGAEPQPSDLYSPGQMKRLERAKGGPIYSPAKGVAAATKLPGGAGGGKGRLAKAKAY